MGSSTIFVVDRSIPSPGSSTKGVLIYSLPTEVSPHRLHQPRDMGLIYSLPTEVSPHRVHQPRDMGLIYSLPTEFRVATKRWNIYSLPTEVSLTGFTTKYGLINQPRDMGLIYSTKRYVVADRSNFTDQPRDVGLSIPHPRFADKYPLTGFINQEIWATVGSSTKRYGLNIFVADRSIPTGFTQGSYIQEVSLTDQPRDMGLIYSLPTEVSPHRVHQPRDMGLIYSLPTEVSPHRVHQPRDMGLNIFVADRSIPSPGSSTKRWAGLNILRCRFVNQRWA
ncbi:unnamed protein product [Acanthosepion pharaonis]|uniref:Uncharacterized protein n=1 Tax=Acanthosepion pharaonis TaxID=158019 RepID=A0A812DVP4_ACAPH|nr:unnamed protein product [Sepia pharaonis]